MSELERELTALAASIEWPETPDASPTVAGALAETPAPVRILRRRLAILVVVALAAILAVLAVPPARTAILDWLGIGAARIVRVDDLPTLPPARNLDLLGRRATVAQARAQAGFPFADPPRGEPAPDEVRVVPGLRVSFVWRDGGKVRLLVTQFPGAVGDPGLLKKLAAHGTTVDRFALDGNQAAWLEGGPHAVLFVSPDGTVREDQGWLAGNTLLVDRRGTTIRVEGAVNRGDAVDLVRAMPSNPSSEG